MTMGNPNFAENKGRCAPPVMFWSRTRHEGMFLEPGQLGRMLHWEDKAWNQPGLTSRKVDAHDKAPHQDHTSNSNVCEPRGLLHL